VYLFACFGHKGICGVGGGWWVNGLFTRVQLVEKSKVKQNAFGLANILGSTTIGETLCHYY